MSSLYIDNQADLKKFCNTLKDSRWITLDTEFIREKTYYPQLCLIQIANHQQAACIDPLAIDNLDSLFDLLYNPAITKVLHSCSQDLEIFYYLRDAVPQPIFDTQLAAAVLGYGEQIGYANLVKAILNIELDKSQTRTDWSRRPLQEKQIEYALDDVRYLCTLYENIQQQLTDTQRSDWLNNDFQKMTDEANYHVNPDAMWRRVKQASRLKGVKLNILKHLASWRERRAIEINRPRRWVMADEVLLNLAMQKPRDKSQLLHIRGLEKKAIDHIGDHLLTLIRQAQQEPEDNWPKFKIPAKPNTEQEALADMVIAILRHQASQHKLSPQLLATRDEVNKVVMGERQTPLLDGWRRQLAGNCVLDFLEGRSQLSCSAQQLTIETLNK